MYRWATITRQKIAKSYIRLSDIRLLVLVAYKGVVVFDMAAPVVYCDKGRSITNFADEDVMVNVSSEGAGVNVLCSRRSDKKDYVEAKCCGLCNLNVEPAELTYQLQHRVLSMLKHPVYRVTRIIAPTMYRITMTPENLRPMFTSNLVSAIGGVRGDSLAELQCKFKENLDNLGEMTPNGYIIPAEYIAHGGCGAVPAAGIQGKYGGAVFQMPLGAFLNEIRNNSKWRLNGLLKHIEACDAVCDAVDSDDRGQA